MFSIGGKNSLIVKYMNSSLSLRQGQRLNKKKTELAKHVVFSHPQSLPRSAGPGNATASSSESAYDWLGRQYQNFFGKPTKLEGMTSAYAFKGVEPGVAAANRNMETIMQSAAQTEEASIAQYVKAEADLAGAASLYVDTTGSSSRYRDQFVRQDDGQVAYVTDRGALKLVGPYDGEVYKSVVGQRGCPGSVRDKWVSSKDNGNGTVGTDPSFFKGTPMVPNEPCGRAGTNSQVMGASLPGSNPRSWEGYCLEGVSGQFTPQEDLVGETAKVAFDQCHARAADTGAAAFYVQDKDSHEFPCFVSKPGTTFDDITASGTPATVEVIGDQWVAQKPITAGNGASMVAGILNDGTITMGTLSNPGAEDYANAVDLASTKGTELAAVAAGENFHGKGCDPVSGATISVKSATFGNNCNGMQFCQLLDQECPPATEKFSAEPSPRKLGNTAPVDLSGYTAAVGDCTGNNLSVKTVDSPSDCKLACDEDASCAGFTWYAGPPRPGWNCIPKSGLMQPALRKPSNSFLHEDRYGAAALSSWVDRRGQVSWSWCMLCTWMGSRLWTGLR